MNPVAPNLACLASAVLCASAGAITDYRTRRIPNRITASGFLAGIAIHVLLNGWHGALLSVGAGVLAGGLFLLFYIAGGMGAGDVKLIAAVCCLAGPGWTAEIIISTSLIGGVFAVALAMRTGRLAQTLSGVGTLLTHHLKSGLKPHPEVNLHTAGALRLPYGIAIAAGTAYTLFSAVVAGVR